MELITGYKELAKLLRINIANLCKKRQFLPKPIKNNKNNNNIKNLIYYTWDYKEMEPYISLAKESKSAQYFWRKVHELNRQKKMAKKESLQTKTKQKKKTIYDNTQ